MAKEEGEEGILAAMLYRKRRQRGVVPLVAVVLDKRRRRRRVQPLVAVALDRKRRRGAIPLAAVLDVCERNTTGEGFPPLVASLVAADNHRPQKRASVLVFKGGGMVVVEAVITALENERLCSFSRAVDGGVPV